MLEVYERIEGPHDALKLDHKLLLTHEQRCRARLKTQTVSGEDVGVFLPHGKPLTVGEYLRSSCGKVIRVDGAAEPIISATCKDALLFARACYHLGNRHVKIQITEQNLRITPDSVLEDMLKQLGLDVQSELAVFIPESGAYHGLGHAHGHSHEKSHGHNHDHSHANGHKHEHS